MITNQGSTSRDDEASGHAMQDSAVVTEPTEQPANPTEQVITAFTAAARGGERGKNAFDVAVRAYIACYPETDRDAAGRIVADIISHRSS